MKRLIGIAAALVATGALAAAAFAGPSYDADGKIVIPENMDRWPTVGTTYALSYEGDGGTTLNSVRLDPESYDAFVKTGVFPVGAMLALEVRTPMDEMAPAKGGKTQGGVVGRSLHVKDEKAGRARGRSTAIAPARRWAARSRAARPAMRATRNTQERRTPCSCSSIRR